MKNAFSLLLKIYDKEGKMTYKTHSTRRAVILSRIRTRFCQNGYLRCTYNNGMFNHTEQHADKKSILWALSTFTESDLVNKFKGTV